MTVQVWTAIFVVLTFGLYTAIAWWTRASSTREFYVAGKGVSPLANGMATAADWMSAASFISMAGIIAFAGYGGSVYLMGWTGGYVLLAVLLAPFLRKFGKFTVPDFVGDRYESNTVRFLAVVCALFVSFTYVAGQMRGVGVVFGRFLEVPVETGVLVGMAIVLFYAVLGGMKGITYTQVAQYCVLIFAFMVPAIFLSLRFSGLPIPQLGFGWGGEEASVLAKLEGLDRELGFTPYTEQGGGNVLNLFAITLALMVGTAGLPHVIVRFFTVPKVRDARTSALWALLFIALLYTTAPAIAVFARYNLMESVRDASWSVSAETSDDPSIKPLPEWVRSWEDIGLIAWVDKDGDGAVDYAPGAAFVGKPSFAPDEARGDHGERVLVNEPTDTKNELYVDRDIMVLANPEISGLPDWVVALVAAGGLAAALSTAAGLLLVVSTSISHDLLKRGLLPNISEKGELRAARIAIVGAVVVAGWLGIDPPGFVAEVVALAFGLAASTFFPVIVLGIFSTRMNKQGAAAGMVTGLLFTASAIVWFRFLHPELDTAEHWWFGIGPKGIGSVGMVLNFVVSVAVGACFPAPSASTQDMVRAIRVPKGAGAAASH
jgi:cation/acetate symporter